MVLRGLACGVFGAGIICLAIRGLKGLAGPNSVVRKRKMLGAFMMIAAVCGAIKPDGGTNSPSGGPPQQQQMMMVPRPLLMMPIGETVSELDVERGYRLDGVATNDASVYVAPSNAVYDTEWSAFGGATDSRTYDIGFDFPLGTNVYRKLNVTQNTSVRKRRRTDDVLLRVSEAISGMRRGVSAFSTWGDGARRIFNWTDCVGDPTTNIFDKSAQLEVRPNGDFTVRSNELAFAYRRITPFDWDDDGLVNGIDPMPRTNGGDFYGQSDAWVLANFTNAEEILSVGYTNWVDGQVGTGLANGLYKFTASFTNAPGRATLLSVGGLSVVVTNAGDYVFLLEKFKRYDVKVSPEDENCVSFAYADDIPQNPSPTQLSCGMDGWWRGDSKRVEFLDMGSSPLFSHRWTLVWYPDLTVVPSSWHPTPEAPTESFTATVADIPPDIGLSYAWHSSDSAIVSVGTPMEQSTTMTCHYPAASQQTAALSLAVAAQGESLSSEDATLFAYYDMYEESDPDGDAVSVAISMPSTIFINNDDDNDDSKEDDCSYNSADDDIGEGCIMVSLKGTQDATVAYDGTVGFSGDVYAQEGLTTALLNAGRTWNIGAAGSWSMPIKVNACSTSGSYLGSSLWATVRNSTDSPRAAQARFTIVEPVVEPICTRTTNVVVDGVEHEFVLNPCGVGVGHDAYFRIGLEPADYPDDQIAWTATAADLVSFPDGNRGRSVRVRGEAPGALELVISIGDCASDKPKFPFRVVTNTVTKISAWIIASKEDMAQTPEAVSRMVETTNDIFSQVGMSFYLGSVTITNIESAYNIPVRDTPSAECDFNRLVDVASNTGGIEVYFVNTFTDRKHTIAINCQSGIVMTVQADGTTLAHEIGHACGLADIYEFKTEHYDLLGVKLCKSHASDDWNQSSWQNNPRYYASKTLQTDVIRRLLMNGETDPADRGCDISNGDVNGIVHADSSIDGSYVVGDATTGIFQCQGTNRSPIHH